MDADAAAAMDALEAESFALSFSYTSDAEFDAVVGYLEDIIMGKLPYSSSLVFRLLLLTTLKSTCRVNF